MKALGHFETWLAKRDPDLMEAMLVDRSHADVSEGFRDAMRKIGMTGALAAGIGAGVGGVGGAYLGGQAANSLQSPSVVTPANFQAPQFGPIRFDKDIPQSINVQGTAQPSKFQGAFGSHHRSMDQMRQKAQAMKQAGMNKGTFVQGQLSNGNGPMSKNIQSQSTTSDAADEFLK